MSLTVVTDRVVEGGFARLSVWTSPPNAVIYRRLEFPITGPTDIWAVAKAKAGAIEAVDLPDGAEVVAASANGEVAVFENTREGVRPESKGKED